MPWTQELKDACELRCGDFGDPGCWELPGLTGDPNMVVEPCSDCLALTLEQARAVNRNNFTTTVRMVYEDALSGGATHSQLARRLGVSSRCLKRWIKSPTLDQGAMIAFAAGGEILLAIRQK